VRLLYFVKKDCQACKTAVEKVGFFLEKWGVADTIETQTASVSTSEGLVEASMREVSEIPTIILEDGGDEVARWIRRPPLSAELRAKLGI
jgi:hypothetical protein